MKRSILITGSTDGIGLATAKSLAAKGHKILLHGRNQQKLIEAEKLVLAAARGGTVASYLADFSSIKDVETMAQSVIDDNSNLDVLINNAGIFKVAEAVTADGLDVRFVVNTIAPYLLTQRLMPLLDTSSRVVNLSSAAQEAVDLDSLGGKRHIADDFSAYAQSKLALTMWSYRMAKVSPNGPVIIALNPGSLLGSKMVKEGFGVDGSDINKGVKILVRAALSDEFATSSGKYFDNDVGDFSPPHTDALDDAKCAAVTDSIEAILAQFT